jgi:uncharacterized membrane protein
MNFSTILLLNSTGLRTFSTDLLDDGKVSNTNATVNATSPQTSPDFVEPNSVHRIAAVSLSAIVVFLVAISIVKLLRKTDSLRHRLLRILTAQHSPSKVLGNKRRLQHLDTIPLYRNGISEFSG